MTSTGWIASADGRVRTQSARFPILTNGAQRSRLLFLQVRGTEPNHSLLLPPRGVRSRPTGQPIRPGWLRRLAARLGGHAFARASDARALSVPLWKGADMAIGLGIVLVVAGLILVLDVVNWDTSAVDTETLGWILLVAGALAIIFSLIVNAQRSRTTQVVEQRQHHGCDHGYDRRQRERGHRRALSPRVSCWAPEGWPMCIARPTRPCIVRSPSRCFVRLPAVAKGETGSSRKHRCCRGCPTPVW